MALSSRSRQILGAAVGVVIIVAIVVATLNGVSFVGPSGPTPLPSSSASDPAAVLPDERLEPGSIRWSFGSPLFDGGLRPVFGLQAGTLAEDEPIIDIEVPYVLPGLELDTARMPVVGAPVGNHVIYVADDGVQSVVHRAEIAADGADEIVGELDDIVWSIAEAPDGRQAYLLLLERGGQGDAGVARLALDGSGALELVLEPAVPIIGASAENRLAAIVPFTASLQISLDGRHVARSICAAALGNCVIDVLDTSSGEVVRLPPQELIGIAGGHVFSMACIAKDCRILAIDLMTAEDRPLAHADGVYLVAEIRGQPALVMTSEMRPDGNATALHVIGLEGGGPVVVLRAPANGWLGLHVNRHFADLQVTTPPGVVLASVSTPVGTRNLAVPLDGGEPVDVPAIPFRLPNPGGLNG
jgi:hypothetical protein